MTISKRSTLTSIEECKLFLIKERISELRSKSNFGIHLEDSEREELKELIKQLVSYNIKKITNPKLKEKLERLDEYDRVKDKTEGKDHEGEVVLQEVEETMKQRMARIVELDDKTN